MNAINIQANATAKEIIAAIRQPKVGVGLLSEDALAENISRALEKFASAILEEASQYSDKKLNMLAG